MQISHLHGAVLQTISLEQLPGTKLIWAAHFLIPVWNLLLLKERKNLLNFYRNHYTVNKLATGKMYHTTTRHQMASYLLTDLTLNILQSQLLGHHIFRELVQSAAVRQWLRAETWSIERKEEVQVVVCRVCYWISPSLRRGGRKWVLNMAAVNYCIRYILKNPFSANKTERRIGEFVYLYNQSIIFKGDVWNSEDDMLFWFPNHAFLYKKKNGQIMKAENMSLNQHESCWVLVFLSNLSSWFNFNVFFFICNRSCMHGMSM